MLALLLLLIILLVIIVQNLFLIEQLVLKLQGLAILAQVDSLQHLIEQDEIHELLLFLYEIYAMLIIELLLEILA